MIGTLTVNKGRTRVLWTKHKLKLNERNKITQVLLRWCGDGESSGHVWLLRDYPEGLRPFRVILRPGRLSRHTDFLRQRVDKFRKVYRAMQRREPETAAAQPVSGGADRAVTPGGPCRRHGGRSPWHSHALPASPRRGRQGRGGGRGDKKRSAPFGALLFWPRTPKGRSAKRPAQPRTNNVPHGPRDVKPCGAESAAAESRPEAEGQP